MVAVANAKQKRFWYVLVGIIVLLHIPQSRRKLLLIAIDIARYSYDSLLVLFSFHIHIHIMNPYIFCQLGAYILLCIQFTPFHSSLNNHWSVRAESGATTPRIGILFLVMGMGDHLIGVAAGAEIGGETISPTTLATARAFDVEFYAHVVSNTG